MKYVNSPKTNHSSRKDYEKMFNMYTEIKEQIIKNNRFKYILEFVN